MTAPPPNLVAASERLVLLARHGQTEWNLVGRWQGHTDIPLDATGREQARALGENLRGHGVAHVVASDLSRARETAEIAARVLGAPISGVDRDLRERAFGIFEGLTREECAARHPEAWQRWSADPRAVPHGAEDHLALEARVATGVTRAALRSEEGQAVLIVSHGGSIRALIAGVTGRSVPPVSNGAVYRLAVDVVTARFRALPLP